MSRASVFTVIYGMIHRDDLKRLKEHLRKEKQSISDYVRGLVSDDLESCGRAPLVPTPPKRRAGPKRGPLRHGTITGYTWRRCRCELCRAAGTKYKREWLTQGAIDGTASGGRRRRTA